MSPHCDIKLQLTFKVVSDIYNPHLSSLRSGKWKSQATLHCVFTGLKQSSAQNWNIQPGEYIAPTCVFQFLQITYVHANMTITSLDEDFGSVSLWGFDSWPVVLQ